MALMNCFIVPPAWRFTFWPEIGAGLIRASANGWAVCPYSDYKKQVITPWQAMRGVRSLASAWKHAQEKGKTMKTQIAAAVLSLALMAGASSLPAADAIADLEKSVAALDEAGKKAEGKARVLERISKDTGVPVKTLEAQKDKSKLGFGGVFIANALAKETGKTFDELVALHKEGKGWGQIAKDNNVKLGPVVSQAKAAEKVAKSDKKPDKRSAGGTQDREVEKHDSELGKKSPASTKPAATTRGGRNGGGRGK